MSNVSEGISFQKQAVDFFDLTTFLIVILLVSMGLISIYSATYDSAMADNFTKQAMFAGLGVGVMLAFMFVPESLLKNFAFIAYAVNCLLLIAVLFFGKTIAGTRGWFDVGGFGIQPSEFAKFTCLMAISRYMTLRGTDVRTLRDLGFALGIIFLNFGLIMLQPDFGTATVLLPLTLGVLFWAGFDLFILFVIIAVPAVFIASLYGTVPFLVSAALLSIVSFFIKKKIVWTAAAIIIFFGVGYFSNVAIDKFMPHQKNRIETFLNPGNDPKGKGYNAIQATMAVGSGGLAGKGFLQGTQTQLRYIPEQRTDFIFCVPTEELGFIGGAFVIVLFAALMWRLVKIATMTESSFFSLIAIGMASMIFYHVFINIGMVIGLMPVMGIPLPFLSYGGSSLLVNMAMIGLVLNAYRSHKKSRYYL